MYATADGQTKVQLGPDSGNGGGNNFVGIWNAYNRVKAFSVSTDTTANDDATPNGFKPDPDKFVLVDDID